LTKGSRAVGSSLKYTTRHNKLIVGIKL